MFDSGIEKRVIDSTKGDDYSVAARPLGRLTIPCEG
jgi:hypothetical protein